MKLPENFSKVFERDGKIKPCTIICCADHGVSEEKVSAYEDKVTEQMVKNYLQEKGAAANAFASYIESELIIVDVGVKTDLSNVKGLLHRKISNGTQNITKGSAMTIEQARQSIEIGKEIVNTLKEGEFNCYLPGEMGISNTTSAAAIVSMMLKVSPEKVTGYGSNISDKQLKHKIEVVKKAIEVNGESQDPIEILSKVGGFEFGAMAGIILGAYENNSLVMIDGFNCSVAALIAQRIEPNCVDCMIATHIGKEPGHKIVLDELKLKPILNLYLGLGEAVGSSIVYSYFGNFIDNEEDDDDDSDDDGLTIEDLQEDTFKQLNNSNVSVTDRTFNFYLNTMPILDKFSMERCQERIDKFCKPLGSLGMIEAILVQTAGISGEPDPARSLSTNLIYITDKIEDKIEDLVYYTTVANVNRPKEITMAFDFGRTVAEDLSFKIPLIGLTTVTDSEEELKSLINEDGTLKYAEEEYLRHLSKSAQYIASAVTGAILSSAHNASMIIIDNNSTEIIARYLEKLCPSVRPFILHTSRLLHDTTNFEAGDACKIAFEIVLASLHANAELKSHEEVGVSEPINQD